MSRIRIAPEMARMLLINGLRGTGWGAPAIEAGYTRRRRLALSRCRLQEPEKPTPRIHGQRESLASIGYQVSSS
jgi:hypothetical protein